MNSAKDIIVFLGKYDDKLLSFENYVYNMIKKKVNHKDSDKKIEYNSNDQPDIKKYTIGNIDFWITLGAAKPTVLLKSLLARSKLIFLIFNFSSEETLTFLEDGWGRIFKEFEKKDTQKRILVGTQPDFVHHTKKKVQSIKETLKCDAYYNFEMTTEQSEEILQEVRNDIEEEEEEKEEANKKDKNEKNCQIIKNLYEYIQSQIHIEGSDDFIIEETKEEGKKKGIRTFKTKKNFVYSFMENNTIELSEAKSAEGDITIPKCFSSKEKKYPITKICDYAFQNSSIQTLSFDKYSEVRQIGDFAFQGSRIRKIIFPSSLEQLSKYWCGGAEYLNEIEVDDNNKQFYYLNGCLIHEKEQVPEILFAPKNYNNFTNDGNHFDRLKISYNIGSYAFYKNERIKLIVSTSKFPTINIGDYSFFGSKNLLSINFKNKEINIGKYCFSESTKLQSIEIKCESKLNIGENCFENCSSLSTITLINESEENLTIPTNAFEGCKSLQTINIRTKSKLILSNELFSENTKLQTVEITGNNIQLCDKCFNKAFNLNKSNRYNYYSNSEYKPCNIKIISQSEVEIGTECFSESNIENVEIEGSIIKLKERSFNKCINLETITISNSNKIIIDELTFNECQNLKNITLNQINSVEFGNQVFSRCKQLTNIKISKSSIFKPIEYFEIITTNTSNPRLTDSIFIRNKNTNELYFTKILKEKYESEKWDEYERFPVERIILISKENNPTISKDFKLYFFIYGRKQYFAKLTKYRKETLSTAFKNKILTGTQKYINAIGIILGLQYLQSLNINNLNLITSKIFLDEKSYPNLNEIIQWNYSTTTIKTHIYSYSMILYEMITGKEISNENHPDLQLIEDQNIQQFIQKCMSPYSYRRPELNEILHEITSEKYINLFKADEYEIHNYLNSFNKNDITEKIEQDNISYIIFKEDKRATIQSSQYNNQLLEIPEYIKYQESQYNITKIYNQSFLKSKLTEIIFPKSIKIIGTRSFNESTQLRTITFLSSTITIGESSFENCISLETIIFSNPISINFGINSFKNCKHINQICTSETKPINIELNESCFSNLQVLIFLEIASKKLKIGMNSFENCESLKTIFLKAETIVILQEPFKNCQQLENITISEASSIKCDDNFFSTIKNLDTLSIQVKEFKIEDNLFNNCSSLKSINIQTNENIKITTNTFKGCKSLRTIKLKSLNTIEISDRCFNDNDNYIESIKIEGQKVQLGKRCFYSSEKLQSISIQSEDLTVDEYCFMSCKELSSISFKNLNTTLNKRAFSRCNNIKTIDINSPTKVEIGSSCFSELANLDKITISSEEIKILENCFNNCAKLTTISIEQSKNTKFKSNAFSDCQQLKNILIDSSSTIEIGNYCFSEAKSLHDITLKSEKIKINEYCFNNCKKLSSISFNEVKEACIGSYAFSGCNKLTEFKLHTSTILKICKYCFSGATNLQIVELSSNNIIIRESIFLGLEFILSVSIQNFQSYYISKDAFNSIPKEKLKLSLV